MEKIILKGRKIVGGVVEGEALVSADPLVWSHGVEPSTGKIDDVRVALNGTRVTDKVLVYPYGKGSTSSSTWMLETFRCNNGPKAILNMETEGMIAIGSILAKKLYGSTAPIIDRFDKNIMEIAETGDWIKVDGDNGIVEITKK